MAEGKSIILYFRLTKILSLTASALGKEQGERITEGRYKGFPVKAGLLMRRRLRDSRENGEYTSKNKLYG